MSAVRPGALGPLGYLWPGHLQRDSAPVTPGRPPLCVDLGTGSAGVLAPLPWAEREGTSPGKNGPIE